MRTLNPEGVNNFLYDATGTTNLDIQMAHWTVFVHYKPVFNAQFTVKLVAVITFLGVSTYLYTKKKTQNFIYVRDKMRNTIEKLRTSPFE